MSRGAWASSADHAVGIAVGMAVGLIEPLGQMVTPREASRGREWVRRQLAVVLCARYPTECSGVGDWRVTERKTRAKKKKQVD